MSRRIIFTSLLVFSLINVSLSTIGMKTSIIKAEDELTELPIWVDSHKWIYDMGFNFETDMFRVNAIISRLCAEVSGTKLVNDREHYKLIITSDSLDGNVYIANLNGPDIFGVMGGYAYVDKVTLGMTEFSFQFDGWVKVLNKNIPMEFKMNMNFFPVFDFFNFPINPSEQSWEMNIDKVVISAEVDIHLDIKPLHYEYIATDEFPDTIYLDDILYKSYPHIDGQYKTFVIGGIWGSKSELFYVPELGFLAKASETINIDGTKANFELDLLETNFLVGNNPPDTPVFVSAPDSGNEGEALSFTVKGTDPDGDDIDYYIDWGDGSNTGWLIGYSSDEPCIQVHTWENMGIYNIIVKTRDENQLESQMSDPYSISILGDPSTFFTIDKIHIKDPIDLGTEAELYYEIILTDENFNQKNYFHHNTHNGKYSGDWGAGSNTWKPGKTHEIKTETKTLDIAIKVFDKDGGLELNNDDLADVSGCDEPDNNGKDDIENVPGRYKRGAVFHQTYDLINDTLAEYSSNYQDYKDYYKISTDLGEYITSGDYIPDESTGDEEFMEEENDCKVWFTIDTNYKSPIAQAEIITPENSRRKGYDIEFAGTVIHGKPDYSWIWDFGDGHISYEQNPKHSFDIVGSYLVNLKVRDEFGQTHQTSFTIQITKNTNPDNLQIKGPNTGKKGEMHTYEFSADDDDGDTIKYYIEWGDGTNTGWLGPFESGVTVTKDHLWKNKGDYTLIFKAKDCFNGETTRHYTVSMPKYKAFSRFFLSDFLQNLFDLLFSKTKYF